MTINDHLLLLIRVFRVGVPRCWAQKSPHIGGLGIKSCGPRRARTVDPRIKSPLLYRLSYRPHCTLNYWVLRLFIRCGSIVSEKTSLSNGPLRLFPGGRELQLQGHPLGAVQQLLRPSPVRPLFEVLHINHVQTHPNFLVRQVV
jgi:hypothetical protein